MTGLRHFFTTAPEAYDYSVTETIARDIPSAFTTHGAWRLVAIDFDPARGTFGQDQGPRYASGFYPCVEADSAEAEAFGLPKLDALLDAHDDCALDDEKDAMRVREESDR